MIGGIGPYEEYVQVDLPWLTSIPAHWQMVPNKALMRVRDERVGTDAPSYTLLSLTLSGVIQRDLENPTGKFPASFETYKAVAPGDLVFCLFDIDETPRTVGLSAGPGMITGAYEVLKPAGSSSASGKYLYQYYLTLDKQKLLKPYYVGLRKTIRIGTFLGLKSPQPPKEEVEAINRFLDYSNQRIDRFVRSKRKLIALLEEQKTNIINQTVTKGLDPDVPLKPSGVSWLGEIPQHWNVNPLKRLLSKMDYGISDPSRSGARYRVLSMAHVSNGSVYIPDGERVGVDSFPNELVLCDGDLLFNRTNSPELVGKVGHFEGKGDEEITFASYLVRLQVATSCEPRWLNYLLNSEHVWSFAKSQALVSLHQANLNPTRYGRIQLPVPPKNEQFDLVVHLDRECALFSDLISKAQREIRLVEEYRTRLISDVVTGQLDVREVEIPDTYEEDPPLDEIFGEPAPEFEEEFEFAEAEA